MLSDELSFILCPCHSSLLLVLASILFLSLCFALASILVFRPCFYPHSILVFRPCFYPFALASILALSLCFVPASALASRLVFHENEDVSPPCTTAMRLWICTFVAYNIRSMDYAHIHVFYFIHNCSFQMYSSDAIVFQLLVEL